jgi:hypothetical protein
MLGPGVPRWKLDIEPVSLHLQDPAAPEDRRGAEIREEKEKLLCIAK